MNKSIKKAMKAAACAALAAAMSVSLFACGGGNSGNKGNGGGNGKSKTEQTREKLAEFITENGSYNPIQNAGNETNFTVTAYEIADYKTDNDAETLIKSVTKGAVAYKVYFESDAYYLDAGDKLCLSEDGGNEAKYFSRASEIGWKNGELKRFVYTKTASGWETEEYASGEMPLESEETSVFAQYEESLEPVQGWGENGKIGINDLDASKYVDLGNVNTFSLDMLMQHYNESTDTFDYYIGASANVDTISRNDLIGFAKADGEAYYTPKRIRNGNVSNVQFRLDENGFTFLSYDLYRLEGDNGCKGVHIELTDFGKTTIDLGKNSPAVSRADYNGKKIKLGAYETLKEEIEKIGKKTNYTVKYNSGEWKDLSYALRQKESDKNKIVFEYELRVTDNATYIYKKMYAADAGANGNGAIVETKSIQYFTDDTHYVDYAYDYSSGQWYKSAPKEMANGTAQSSIAHYAEIYWNTLGGKTALAYRDIRYSNTLKGFVGAGFAQFQTSNRSGGDVSLHGYYDGYYKLNENGICEIYNTFLGELNAAESDKQAYTYTARGIITRRVYNVGATQIEIPQNATEKA